MSRSMYITYKHKLLQRKENQNYNPHCFHFQYCTFFFFWEHFIVCLWSVRPGDHEWQNAKTAGLKWEGKKGQRLQTEYVFHEHTVLVDLNSIGAKRRNRNDLLWLLLWIKKHIIKTTSLIHIQPRSMQCQGFWFVTLWKAFSTNNVSYQYSIYALHKKTLPDF